MSRLSIVLISASRRLIFIVLLESSKSIRSGSRQVFSRLGRTQFDTGNHSIESYIMDTVGMVAVVKNLQ